MDEVREQWFGGDGSDLCGTTDRFDKNEDAIEWRGRSGQVQVQCARSIGYFEDKWSERHV